MNKSLIKNINDESARKVIFHMNLQIEALNLKIDRLEQQVKPVPAIGFHQNPCTATAELAFKNIRHHVPD